MKKLHILTAVVLILSTLNFSTNAAPVKFSDPAMLSETDPASYEPYPIALNATSYTPWFTSYHLQTQDHASRGIRGGEGGQMIMSLGISPVNPELMLMGSDMAGIWRSTDGGDNWYSVTDNANFRAVNDIIFHPSKENIVFCTQGTKGLNINKYNSTQMDGLYRSTDGGHSWEQVLGKNILTTAACYNLVRFDDAGNVYALTSEGVFKSKDDGANWEHLGIIDENVEKGVFTLWVSGNGNTLLAATGDSGISISTSGGIFWEKCNGNLSSNASSLAVDPTNSQHWYAVFPDDEKILYHTYDGGVNWTPVKYAAYAAKNKPVAVRASYLPKKGIVRLIVKYREMSRPIRYSDDGGETWFEPKCNWKDSFTGSNGYYAEGTAICESNPEIVLNSYGDVIYKSTDGGETFWWSNGGYSGNYALDFDIDSQGRLLIAHMDRGLVRTDTAYKKGEYPTLTKMGVSATVGQVEIDPRNPNHIYATSGSWDEQVLKESTDGGETWSDVPGFRTAKGCGVFEYHKTNPNIIYTSEYTSYNGGTTWTKNEQRIYAVSPVNSNVLYGVANSGIVKSTDCGSSWEIIASNLSAPKAVRADIADENTVWVGCYNGSVVKITGTEKVKFDDSNGLIKFGDAVNSVSEISQNPKNPNHLLLGMTSSDGSTKTCGLYETYDGGQNWHVVKGLSSARNVNTIEFSPVSDEAFIGTCSNGTIFYDYNVYRQYMDGTLQVDKSDEILLPVDADKVRVMMNGRTLSFDRQPFIENGRTLVPFRKIFEEIGAEVQWIGETQTVKAVKEGTTIELQIGSTTAKVNGHEVILDVAPCIYDSRTMVPLRFISENLNASVEWNAKLRRVEIDTK